MWCLKTNYPALIVTIPYKKVSNYSKTGILTYFTTPAYALNIQLDSGTQNTLDINDASRYHGRYNAARHRI